MDHKRVVELKLAALEDRMEVVIWDHIVVKSHTLLEAQDHMVEPIKEHTDHTLRKKI